jgi:hypothetical protein
MIEISCPADQASWGIVHVVELDAEKYLALWQLLRSISSPLSYRLA